MKDADVVIKLQTDMIAKLGDQNVELLSENDRLSNALVTLREDYDSEIKSVAIAGGAGLLLGILVGVLIPR